VKTWSCNDCLTDLRRKAHAFRLLPYQKLTFRRAYQKPPLNPIGEPVG
jgi:hypothetical protein